MNTTACDIEKRKTRRWGIPPMLALSMLVSLGAVHQAQGATAYWWGTTSANWSGNNWSSTDASSGAVFTPYTLVNGDSLLWYWSATANAISTNNLSGLSVAALDFRRTKTAFTLRGNPLTLTGNVSYGGGHTIDLDLIANVAYLTLGGAKGDIAGTAPPLIINGNISETGGARNVTSGGPLYLNGANSFTGLFTATGTIHINTLANNDAAQSLGQGTIQFGSGSESNGGTIIYSGGATSTDKPFRIGRLHQSTGNLGGGAFLNNGTGAVVWQGPQSLASSIDSPRTLTLGGSNTDANDWQSAIGNNDPDCPVSVTKKHAGKWILSGGNSYSGATTVEQGTLLINGTQSGTGTVTVATDARLGGSGTVGGDVVLAAGGMLQPYDTGSGVPSRLTITGEFDIGNGILDLSGLGTVKPGQHVLAEFSSKTGDAFASVEPQSFIITYTSTQILLSPLPCGTVVLVR